jgi:hypothetical protein
VVAAMLGHQGTRTLHKHYNHALAKVSKLVSALRRQVHALPGEMTALHGDDGGPEQQQQPGEAAGPEQGQAPPAGKAAAPPAGKTAAPPAGKAAASNQ